MQKYLGILSSDALNRDGYVIVFEALEDSIAKNAIEGMPSLIDHDIHRPLGWIFPYGILIEPKISKTVGNFFVCETDEDSKLIYPKIQDFWQRIHYERTKDYKDKFIELLNENYKIEGQFVEKGCVAYHLPNIVEIVFPSLFENKDKNDLIYLNDILKEFDYVGSGIFKSKNGKFCIFCHQYFNRNLSLLNNYNTYFIDEFINKTIALTIGWEMKDFEVRLSVFGKSSEIVKWLNTTGKVPIEYESFKVWLSNQRKWIYDNYNYTERDFSHLLKDDGIFYIKRKAINNEYISFPKDEDKFYYEVNTNGNKELNNLIEEKVIFPSHIGLLKKISCTKTGEDYLTSMTSKYLDTDVKMAIEEINLLGFFWTDEEYQ